VVRVVDETLNPDERDKEGATACGETGATDAATRGLEGQPRTNPDQAGAGGGGDLSVQCGLPVRRRRIPADQIEGIGSLAAELKRESFEMEVSEHSQVYLPVSGRS
jgi:hypothetical protein